MATKLDDQAIPSAAAGTPAAAQVAKDKGIWRDLAAYWILGLCNNYGYVVMLSAAHDILAQAEANAHRVARPNTSTGRRDCNYISTGAILLADILPALIIKFTAPFLPFLVHVRIVVCCIASAAGFLLVAFSAGDWMAIVGVVSTAFSSGLGEVTFLSYSARFNRNVISTWSSGTGGAGIIGAVSYAGLLGLGFSPFNTMLIMLVVPFAEALAFWVLLRAPRAEEQHPALAETGSTVARTSAVTFVPSSPDTQSKPLANLIHKFSIVPQSFKYMIPLLLVYFLEYFINQGLFELLHFENSWLTKSEQYRWLQVDYQVGVFISRSSVNIVHMKQVWIMALLQFVNVILLLFEVVYSFIPNIWIIFAIVLWEGLLGGGAYVNTFYRMTREVPAQERKFLIGITSLSDALGIAFAGWVAIPSHNALCNLPK